MFLCDLVNVIEIRDFNQYLGFRQRASVHQFQVADGSQERSASAEFIAPARPLLKPKRAHQRGKTLKVFRGGETNKSKTANHRIQCVIRGVQAGTSGKRGSG